MKQFIKIILFFFLAGIAVSCTEIIHLDINSSDPQLVVEAQIGEGEPAVINLTKSVNLDDEDDFPIVSGAIITLSDASGNTENLEEIIPGKYVSISMRGRAGETYHIDIEVEDKSVTASCDCPDRVNFDSMKVVNSVYPGGGDIPLYSGQSKAFYEITVAYQDPPEIDNFYRFEIYVNNSLYASSIYNDERYNGLSNENTIIIYNDSIKTGDKITVEMQCISKEVYNYFNSMENSGMSSGNSSSPSNPYTNLVGTDLGYFSAYTVQRKDYIKP
ncbi:MAG: DUF4249 domain-containing protein [Paludibacter sp.]|nr:DUF4249 domain-containing protein [Paludibacter sp.]